MTFGDRRRRGRRRLDLDLAEAVRRACSGASSFDFLYPLDLPIKDKIWAIAKEIYRASDIKYSEEAEKKVSALAGARAKGGPS